MGGSKPKPVQTPFQQEQKQQTTYGLFSPSDTPEAKEFLSLPLDFGGSNYGGDAFKDYGNAYKDYSGKAYEDYSGNAYQDIKNDFKFNVDPGVGRRGALAEQGVMNRWDSSLMAGVPAFLRQQLKSRDLRETRGQNVGEAQQAEFTRQNAQQRADYESSLARAGMRDAGELNRARFRDESERNQATLRDASELNRAQGMNAADLARAQMRDQSLTARTLAELERRRQMLPQLVQTGGSGSSSGFNTQLTQPQGGFLSSFGSGLGSSLGSALPFI